MNEEPLDPYKEIIKNLEMIGPVKRCPECQRLSLSFDKKKGRIYCEGCGFEKFMPKVK